MSCSMWNTNSFLCSLVSSCRILFLFVKVLPRESSRSPHARCTVLLGSTIATTTPRFHLSPGLLTTFAWLCWILPRGVHRWYGKSSSHSGKLFNKVVYIGGGGRLLPALLLCVVVVSTWLQSVAAGAGFW